MVGRIHSMFRRVTAAGTSSLAAVACARTVVHNFAGPDIAAEVKKANGKPVVVDCYADWCGPCIQFSPKYDPMSEKQPDVHFVKMNVEEFEDVAAEYGLRSVPTFLVFDKDGKKQAVIEGAAEHKIQAAIDAVVAAK